VSWCDRAVKEAKERIAQESELLRKSYSSEFMDFARATNLFFSLGDIEHLIRSGLDYRIRIRHAGGGAGIACFEDLIRRFRLYIIQELKTILANREPYRFSDTVNFELVSDLLDLMKILDKDEQRLKEIRQKEGGYFQ